MKHTVSLVFSAIAMLVALSVVPMASSAQPAPTYTPVPAQKPDFSSMMFLTGTWTCHQTLRGKDRPDTSTTTIGMDGAWMITQDAAPPFDQYRTYTINGTTYTTYDSTLKQWVQTGVDSSGGYFTSTSPGWQADVMTWTTKGLDGSSATDVLTKHGDNDFIDENTSTDASAKTTKTVIHCTKQPG